MIRHSGCGHLHAAGHSILNKEGFRHEDARRAIESVERIAFADREAAGVQCNGAPGQFNVVYWLLWRSFRGNLEGAAIFPLDE